MDWYISEKIIFLTHALKVRLFSRFFVPKYDIFARFLQFIETTVQIFSNNLARNLVDDKFVHGFRVHCYKKSSFWKSLQKQVSRGWRWITRFVNVVDFTSMGEVCKREILFGFLKPYYPCPSPKIPVFTNSLKMNFFFNSASLNRYEGFGTSKIQNRAKIE